MRSPTRTARRVCAACLLTALTSVSPASATIVQFDTSLGTIEVRLYDTATPASVANFLNYVFDDDYDGSFFHRAPLKFREDSEGNRVLDEQGQPIIDTFVVQGGGFTYSEANGLGNVPTDPPVVNEPGISNLPGTIAYAKQADLPDSATSGFFFNTTNNVNNLDNQNGGFTVFGRVVSGQETLDAITALPAFDLDPAPDPTPGNPNPVNPPTFDNVPIFNVPGSLEQNLIFLNDVRVLDIAEGDFNFDGVVDAADFTVYRDTLGSTTDAAADGNGDGVVGPADLAIWRAGFGEAGAATAAVPEPASLGLAVALIASLAGRTRRERKKRASDEPATHRLAAAARGK